MKELVSDFQGNLDSYNFQISNCCRENEENLRLIVKNYHEKIDPILDKCENVRRSITKQVDVFYHKKFVSLKSEFDNFFQDKKKDLTSSLEEFQNFLPTLPAIIQEIIHQKVF